MNEQSRALIVPTAAPREILARAGALLEKARALVETDPLAGLAEAAKVQKAMKIYGRILVEAKAHGRLANMATVTRLKAERLAGEALEIIAKTKGGRPKKNSFHSETSFQDACREAGISRPTAHHWRWLAVVPERRFEAYIAKADSDATIEITRRDLLRTVKSERNRRERTERLDTIARGGEPLALPERYPVLYIDPPWRYEHVKTESRAIENQYPTMDLEDICALPVAANATVDAILFLWATSPKLAEAFDVLAAWGFTYRTSMVWVKPQIGMGYWARQQHELLLIATKGEPPTPAPADRPASVITAKRGAHSAKPLEFYDVIERMFPTLPKVELFARRKREGWSQWGNDPAVAR